LIGHRTNGLYVVDFDRLRRLNDLLKTALDLPQDQRAAWLQSLPDRQRALVPTLQQMLDRATVETDSFMQRPISMPGNIEGDSAGDVIGPYRLDLLLGQGGMATVWRARRCDGTLQRDIALKLPHAGWAPSIVKRMERERDILAGLEHPCIARLYDAGLADQGRPWLAMELVDGLPIDRFSEQRGLSIAQKLRLFLQVTDAVGHAHARLVIHRDLKPNNILVSPDGQVHLLDFGVAKLIEDDAPHSDQLTRQLGRPVTPDYAAPELLAGKVVCVSSDVYSLGIVLYELLVGERPYSLDRQTKSLEEAVLEAHTPAMSARARSKPLIKALRGDLDTIVAKALRKRSVDRYPTVDAMAADVRRYLDGEPVLAQAPTWRYRTAKFVRRHRWPMAGASLMTVSLLSGLGVAVWQAGVARAEAARAEQAKQFVASIFSRAQPRQGVQGTLRAADLLVVAGERIERELADDPKTASELGVMIGEGLSRLGEHQRGQSILRNAVQRATLTYGPRHPITVRGRAYFAASLAVEFPEEAARVAEALVPDALAGLPTTIEAATAALRAHSFQLAKRDEAEPSYAALKQAVALAERYEGPNHEDTAFTLGLLSNTYGRFGEFELQLETATQALERARAGLGSQRPHVSLTAVERWYAEALRRNDQPADAVPILRRVVEDQRQLDGSDTVRVRNAIYQLGLAHAEVGEIGEALPLMREALALEAQHNAVDNADRRDYRAAMAVVMGFARRSGEALDFVGRDTLPLEALPIAPTLTQVLFHVRTARLMALEGDVVGARRIAAGVVPRVQGRLAPYRSEALSIEALAERLHGRTEVAYRLAESAWNDPDRGRARPAIQASIAAEWATVLLDRGDHKRAATVVQQALTLYQQAQVVPSPRTATAWLAQVRLHLHAGRAVEAEIALRPLLASYESANPASAWHGEALHWWARTQSALGKSGSAREARLKSAALLRASSLPALKRLAATS
jgi:eukaryotic-like serine/threonine-protein kinase